jgi:hypothetical protein
MVNSPTIAGPDKMGRPFVGIELDPAHFAVAVRRIEDAQRQTDLFAETVAETMRKQPCPETAMVPRSGLEPELTRNGILSPAAK